MKIKTYFFLLVWSFAFACTGQTPEEVSNDLLSVSYFDTRLLVQNISQHVSNQSAKVRKRVALNQKIEEKEQLVKDWNKELVFFSEASINKKALLGTYQLVSPTKNEQKYTTLDPHNKVKTVSWNKDLTTELEKVQIHYLDENALFRIERKLTLTYKGAQLYTYHIDGTKQMMFGEPVSYLVEGELLR